MFIPPLPVELYSEIFSYIFRNDELTRLALVNHTFRDLVRRLLYKDIILDGVVSPHSIDCLQTLSGNVSLAKQVRHLAIVDFAILPRSMTMHKVSKDIVSTSIVSRVLQSTSSLRSLMLTPIINFNDQEDPCDTLGDSGLSPGGVSSVIAHALFRPRQRSRYPSTLLKFRTNLRHPLIFDFINEQVDLKEFAGLPTDGRPFSTFDRFAPAPPSLLEDLSTFGRLETVTISGTSFFPLIRRIIESFANHPRNKRIVMNEICFSFNEVFLPNDYESLLYNLNLTGMYSLDLRGCIGEMESDILPPLSPLQNDPFNVTFELDPPENPYVYMGDDEFDLSVNTFRIFKP